MYNGMLKFNMIGLPYNLKKLVKNPNYSGHVSYSAPELIKEQPTFDSNIDTWALGCSLYYLVTKQDPFLGQTVEETKNNILKLQIDKTFMLKYHN
jgi:serine/threonine protein kinase